MMRLTIRWRLTLLYAGLLLLLLASMSTLVLWRVHHHLLENADTALYEEINELVEEMQYFDQQEEMIAELKKRFSVHAHYHFQVLDAQKQLIFQSRFLTNITLPPAQNPAEMRGRKFENIQLPGLGQFRLLSMSVRDSHARPLMLRAILSREELNRDFHSYVWMFLTLGPIAIIGALVAGHIIAGNLLSPIQRINKTAKRISADRLGDRLPIANPNDELGELSMTLNQAFDRLETSMDSMRRFTSDAAHELRSPVAVLRTEAEIALRKPRSAEEYRSVIETTLAETIRLSAIVDQLLTLSRHDSGVQAMLTDEVPAGAILSDVAARFKATASEKGIDLSVDEIPACFLAGHELWLSQLFSNLIDNAIKFTPTGGQVAVSARVDRDNVTFVVEDSGIGIEAKNVPFIFDRFYREDGARGHHRGTGLGLAICKSIVDAHRGTIAVESTPNQCTRFSVRLPLLRDERSHSVKNASKERSSQVVSNA